MSIPKMEMRCWKCKKPVLVVWQVGDGWHCFDCLPRDMQAQLREDAMIPNEFGASIRGALELAKLRIM